MALAQFKLNKRTGTNGVTVTDTSWAPTFLSADLHSATPANYPIPIPATSGSPTSYSMECQLELECTAAPDNSCSAFKVWGPNVRPDSPTDKLTIYGGTQSTLVTPTSSQSSIATARMDTNHYSAGTGLAIGVVPVDDIINAVGEKTDPFILQLAVAYGATQGNMTPQIFYVGWTES